QPQDPTSGNGHDPGPPVDETAELIAAIVRGENYHAPIASLAMWYLNGGMADAQTVQALRGIMLAVHPAQRDFKDGVWHKDRWRSRYDDIPRVVATARAKINPPPGPSNWSQPADLLATTLSAAPPFPSEFLPGALGDFVCDIADRMQCPADVIA